MNTKKNYKKQDQNSLSKCIKCHKTHTLHMMIQVNTWANRYKCIKCFNKLRKERTKEYYRQNSEVIKEKSKKRYKKNKKKILKKQEEK